MFFLLSVVPITVGRDQLNYEILDIKMDKNHIIVNGWGLMPDTQHFLNDTTHKYELKLSSSNNEVFTINGKILDIDMTQQMKYRGYPMCENQRYFRKDCNYFFKNVGFQFMIPLKELKVNEKYQMHLIMHALDTKKKYEIPVFYVQEGDLLLNDGRKQYTILSDFKHASFQIFASTLVAREKASPLSNPVYLGKSCSKTYENLGFIRQNAKFKNIYDIEKYNGLITYFKVRVQPSGCVNQRQRLIESNNSSNYVYVPSNFANYLGKPAEIKVDFYTTYPIIYAESITINQYKDYDPYEHATAYDNYDGDLTDDIIITYSNVNVRVPGTYKTCYSVTNRIGKKADECANVYVLKVPSKIRFISRYTVHDTYLKWWDRNTLEKIYRNNQGRNSIKISLD